MHFLILLGCGWAHPSPPCFYPLTRWPVPSTEGFPRRHPSGCLSPVQMPWPISAARRPAACPSRPRTLAAPHHMCCTKGCPPGLLLALLNALEHFREVLCLPTGPHPGYV